MIQRHQLKLILFAMFALAASGCSAAEKPSTNNGKVTLV